MTMSKQSAMNGYGVLTEHATLKIERLLPGPIERVWAFLTESDLRRKWLASGEMEMKVGATFELVWRNDELNDPPTKRPPGFDEEHRMQAVITELDPPRRLAYTWGRSGGVTFELEPRGNDVMLTLTHHRLPDRQMLLMVSAGWHAHLDMMAARIKGEPLPPFWETWQSLKTDYDHRLPQ